MYWNVRLAVDEGVGDREINAWITQWNDHAGGRWGAPLADEDLPNIWWVPLEVANKDKVKGAIDHTMKSNAGLVDYGFHERNGSF